MKGIFIHHPVFRLIFPPLYGTLVYVLVLLVFDSIRQLEENFFSQEVLLCVGLTYALTESLRLVIRHINKLFPEFRSVQRRLFIYLSASLSCSLLVISVGVSGYFRLVLGYSSFTTELITLNSIFLVSTVLYTLVYFGIFYLNHFNRRRLDQETALREKMEYQLESLKTDVNPQLLYTSLEQLVHLVHQDPDEADNYLDCMAQIYRYSLQNKMKEMIAVQEEVAAAQNLVKLLNYAHQGLIRLQVNLEPGAEARQLIPGTLQKLVEYAVNRSLISSRQPLLLTISANGPAYLQIRYKLHERLLLNTLNTQALQNLVKAYRFFTDKPLECTEEDDNISIRVPFLQVETKAALVTEKSEK